MRLLAVVLLAATIATACGDDGMSAPDPDADPACAAADRVRRFTEDFGERTNAALRPLVDLVSGEDIPDRRAEAAIAQARSAFRDLSASDAMAEGTAALEELESHLPDDLQGRALVVQRSLEEQMQELSSLETVDDVESFFERDSADAGDALVELNDWSREECGFVIDERLDEALANVNPDSD